MDSSERDEIDAFHADRGQMMLDSTGYSDDDSVEGISEEDSEVLPLDGQDYREYYFNESESCNSEDESKAWGSSKKSFYNQEEVGLSSSEEGEDLEEKEAIALQDKMAAILTDSDFQSLIPHESTEGVMDEQVVQDLSKLPSEDRLAIMERNFPELYPLIHSFKKSFSYVLHTLLPSYSTATTDSGKQVLELILHLNLCYCINVMFYLQLKASKQDTKTHPVIGRILSIKQLISRMENFDLSNVDTILEGSPPIVPDGSEQRVQSQEDPLVYYESMRKVKGHVKLPPPDHDGEFEYNGEKRPISYQISRNKGLTPKRRKEQRNPRVKHRNKFKKALVKRKGQVLPVQTEVSRYGGESSGIKSNVARSVKIK